MRRFHIVSLIALLVGCQQQPDVLKSQGSTVAQSPPQQIGLDSLAQSSRGLALPCEPRTDRSGSPDRASRRCDGITIFVLDTDTIEIGGHGTTIDHVIRERVDADIRAISVGNAETRAFSVGNAENTGLNTLAVMDALRGVADHAANNPDLRVIVNVSWGSYHRLPVIERLFARLEELGVLVVAAAGNDGTDRPQYPAANPGSIAVGASVPDALNRYTIAPYSNRGKHVTVFAEDRLTKALREAREAIAEAARIGVSTAPDARRNFLILQELLRMLEARKTVDRYSVQTEVWAAERKLPESSNAAIALRRLKTLIDAAPGTSYTTPQVTAVVASMLKVNPDLSVAEVRSVLAESSATGILEAEVAVGLARRTASKKAARSRLTDPSRDTAISAIRRQRGYNQFELISLHWLDFDGDGAASEFYAMYKLPDAPRAIGRTIVELFRVADGTAVSLYYDDNEGAQSPWIEHFAMDGTTFVAHTNSNGNAPFLRLKILRSGGGGGVETVFDERTHQGHFYVVRGRPYLRGSTVQNELRYVSDQFIQSPATVPELVESRSDAHVITPVIANGRLAFIYRDGTMPFHAADSTGSADVVATEPIVLTMDEVLIVDLASIDGDGRQIKVSSTSGLALIPTGYLGSVITAVPLAGGKNTLAIHQTTGDRTSYAIGVLAR
jgi:hypothetical protein